MLGRQMPWKPSQPPMKSQASSMSRPPWRQRIFGARPAKSCTLTSLASIRICPPSASRRSIKSFTIYGQQEVVKDLIERRLADGGQILFEASDGSVHDFGGSGATIR